MSTTACRDCGNQVSKAAKACPQCGKPRKKGTSLFTWLVALIMGIWLFNAATNPPSPQADTRSTNGSAPEKKHIRTASEVRQERIEAQFSAWNGAHRGLERFVKSTMNDPDSYDHAKTVYWDMDDHLVVRTFGGVVLDSVKAKVSLDGKVLEVLGE